MQPHEQWLARAEDDLSLIIKGALTPDEGAQRDFVQAVDLIATMQPRHAGSSPNSPPTMDPDGLGFGLRGFAAASSSSGSVCWWSVSLRTVTH